MFILCLTSVSRCWSSHVIILAYINCINLSQPQSSLAESRLRSSTTGRSSGQVSDQSELSISFNWPITLQHAWPHQAGQGSGWSWPNSISSPVHWDEERRSTQTLRSEESVWIPCPKTGGYKEGLLESGDLEDPASKCLVSVAHEKFTLKGAEVTSHYWDW